MDTPLRAKIAETRCSMSVQKRRKYSDEFKQDAVDLVLKQGYKVSEAARNLGINAGMLRRWINHVTDAEDQVSGKPDDLKEAEARIRELEAENKRLLMEREILKKATAFFAKESK